MTSVHTLRGNSSFHGSLSFWRGQARRVASDQGFKPRPQVWGVESYPLDQKEVPAPLMSQSYSDFLNDPNKVGLSLSFLPQVASVSLRPVPLLDGALVSPSVSLSPWVPPRGEPGAQRTAHTRAASPRLPCVSWEFLCWAEQGPGLLPWRCCLCFPVYF